ncbi:helix-turn-helix transcriptional regulator [Streptomyces sp. AV19]|uniref:DUF5937 family protein n=1 Tax=Streptomyces sp. AV19 TaxID=2793068 RepID=UPI0018FE03B4|nr:DUF5937 family protein [Streptomyces sp. AV19]MBH1934957.1 helix-turn-helix transcriptional regulator [Streptomyces sp. AV19]MDG4534562.1 DUF5937 family protein [Streptomyces sp. AV19]
MSVTIDIAGLPPERVLFAASPLAELGHALHVLAEPSHHPGLHGWVTATATGLKPDLADRLCEADSLWGPVISDVFTPLACLPSADGRPGATLAEELDMLDRLDDERYVEAALDVSCSGYYTSVGPPLRDARSRAVALERAAARGPRAVVFARRLLDDPPGVRTWLRRLFEDCEQAFFGDVWRRVGVQLATDARHKTEVLRRRGLREALAEVSPAVSVDDRGTLITVDKLTSGRATALAPEVGPGLTLVPSSLGWPHLLVLSAPGWRPMIHYPVGMPELPDPASLDLLKLRMEALAHPMRLRMCRWLARSACTTGELATEHGISAPEASRHLAVLKKAGLLTTRRRGRYVLHQLDLTVVARLGSDFLEGVLR